MERSYGCSRKAVLITLLLVVFVFLCATVSLVTVDSICWNNMTQKLPIYPEATIVFQRHNFLRPFGMGTTVMTLETEDSPDVVRDWYGRAVGAAARAAKDSDNRLYDVPIGRVSITGAEDGTGSQIILSGDCIS
jgi:hypothetical protein